MRAFLSAILLLFVISFASYGVTLMFDQSTQTAQTGPQVRL